MENQKIPNETIAALATPTGRGGIAVIRISGPLVTEITKQLLHKLPKPRYATFSLFLDEENQAIDEGIALFFPGPHSFTGEDILELQGHGGPAVVNALLKRICQLGARLAYPGEFSKRAFLNDKIDLTQAEAIADLIDASSEQAARASLRSLQGEFSKKIHSLVEALIKLRMYIEAAIDFVEEEVDFLSTPQIGMDLNNITEAIKNIRASANQGSLLRDGITVVITGKPNVGKSSLLNCLSGKEVAIVTDIPGTTRDLLREYILLDDLPIHFIDTAGLRESTDPVEKIGIHRAREEMSRADLILCLTDNDTDEIDIHDLPKTIPIIQVRNKIDLVNQSPTVLEQNQKTIIALSAKMNLGINLLKEKIKSLVGFEMTNENTFSARRRHLEALDKAYEYLLQAYDQLYIHKAYELLAEDLRSAQLALNEITGEFTTDDLLGRIFSSFCIGK